MMTHRLPSLRRFARALDYLFPPACLICGEGVARHGALCPPCWEGAHFIAEPMCGRCGRPFDAALAGASTCGACLKAEPPFAFARAVLRYDAASKPLVLAFKYRDQTQLAPIFAQWMALAGRELLARSDVIVPVPLHRRRFMKRRYNQAALLANAIAKAEGMSCRPAALLRVRATKPQAGLSREQRRRNVRGAFSVAKGEAEQVRGRHVLLIDDVMTSGVTAAQCCKALKKAGAASVSVLTLARRG